VSRNTTLSKITLLVALGAALCAPLACASSARLDRSKAAEMIRRSGQFAQPYTIIIRHQTDSRQLDPVVPSDTRQQGEARAVEEFFNASPYRGVLRELGLVTATASYQHTTMYGQREGPSLYKLDVRLTEKGEQLWRDLKLPVDPATLPLARRELISITGITGGDERARHATVEFDWRWIPTAAGRAMMRDTPEFSQLPDRIKQKFNEEGLSVFNIGAHPPLELGGTRHAVANLQLYDDGWRLTDVRPMATSPLNPLD
jgi:hypothetical protein